MDEKKNFPRSTLAYCSDGIGIVVSIQPALTCLLDIFGVFCFSIGHSLLVGEVSSNAKISITEMVAALPGWIPHGHEPTDRYTHLPSPEVLHCEDFVSFYLITALVSWVADGLLCLVSAVFIESATGIREGGRTGVTALVTGFCFFVALFFAPLLGSPLPRTMTTWHCASAVLSNIWLFSLGVSD